MAGPKMIKQLGKQTDMSVELLRREKDHFDQINRALKERDDTISGLITPFRTIAAGRVQMNGAGGFTIKESSGCTLSLSGTDLRITFATPQPTPLRYNVVGTRIGGGTRAQFLTLYTSAACIVRLTDMGNITESFAAVGLSYAFTVETF